MAMKCLKVTISFAVVKSSLTFICIVIDTMQVNSTTKRFYMAELSWSTQIFKKNERVWVKGIDLDLKPCDENDELEIWPCFWK